MSVIENNADVWFMPHRVSSVARRNTMTPATCDELERSLLETCEQSTVFFRVLHSRFTRFTGWFTVDYFGHRLRVTSRDVIRV